MFVTNFSALASHEQRRKFKLSFKIFRDFSLSGSFLLSFFLSFFLFVWKIANLISFLSSDSSEEKDWVEKEKSKKDKFIAGWTNYRALIAGFLLEDDSCKWRQYFEIPKISINFFCFLTIETVERFSKLCSNKSRGEFDNFVCYQRQHKMLKISPQNCFESLQFNVLYEQFPNSNLIGFSFCACGLVIWNAEA